MEADARWPEVLLFYFPSFKSLESFRDQNCLNTELSVSVLRSRSFCFAFDVGVFFFVFFFVKHWTWFLLFLAHRPTQWKSIPFLCHQRLVATRWVWWMYVCISVPLHCLCMSVHTTLVGVCASFVLPSYTIAALTWLYSCLSSVFSGAGRTASLLRPDVGPHNVSTLRPALNVNTLTVVMRHSLLTKHLHYNKNTRPKTHCEDGEKKGRKKSDFAYYREECKSVLQCKQVSSWEKDCLFVLGNTR